MENNSGPPDPGDAVAPINWGINFLGAIHMSEASMFSENKRGRAAWLDAIAQRYVTNDAFERAANAALDAIGDIATRNPNAVVDYVSTVAFGLTALFQTLNPIPIGVMPTFIMSLSGVPAVDNDMSSQSVGSYVCSLMYGKGSKTTFPSKGVFEKCLPRGREMRTLALTTRYPVKPRIFLRTIVVNHFPIHGSPDRVSADGGATWYAVRATYTLPYQMVRLGPDSDPVQFYAHVNLITTLEGSVSPWAVLMPYRDQLMTLFAQYVRRGLNNPSNQSLIEPVLTFPLTGLGTYTPPPSLLPEAYRTATTYIAYAVMVISYMFTHGLPPPDMREMLKAGTTPFDLADMIICGEFEGESEADTKSRVLSSRVGTH